MTTEEMSLVSRIEARIAVLESRSEERRSMEWHRSEDWRTFRRPDQSDPGARMRYVSGQGPYSNGGGGGDPEATPPAGAGFALHVYEFESWANAALNGIIMEPGDVWAGPNVVCHWSSITSATTTPAVSSTNTCVWLSVDLTAFATNTGVTMKVSTRAVMENLDGGDATKILGIPLVETFWDSGVITKVRNLWCKIPRAAG